MNFHGTAPKTVSGQQHPQIFTSLKLEALLLAQKRNKKDKERSLQ
jgi:hypothetical protein